MKNSLGLDFIDRSIKMTGALLLVVMAYGTYHLGFYPALALFSGGVWGMINLMLITAMVKASIRPDGISGKKVAAIALIKFPFLYLAGYFLLRVSLFEPWLLLMGSATVFVVIVLKAGGRLMMGLDNSKPKAQKLAGTL